MKRRRDKERVWRWMNLGSRVTALGRSRKQLLISDSVTASQSIGSQGGRFWGTSQGPVAAPVVEPRGCQGRIGAWSSDATAGAGRVQHPDGLCYRGSTAVAIHLQPHDCDSDMACYRQELGLINKMCTHTYKNIEYATQATRERKIQTHRANDPDSLFFVIHRERERDPMLVSASPSQRRHNYSRTR